MKELFQNKLSYWSKSRVFVFKGRLLLTNLGSLSAWPSRYFRWWWNDSLRLKIEDCSETRAFRRLLAVFVLIWYSIIELPRFAIGKFSIIHEFWMAWQQSTRKAFWGRLAIGCLGAGLAEWRVRQTRLTELLLAAICREISKELWGFLRDRTLQIGIRQEPESVYKYKR